MNKRNFLKGFFSLVAILALFATISGLMVLGLNIAKENENATQMPVSFMMCVVTGLLLMLLLMQPEIIDAWIEKCMSRYINSSPKNKPPTLILVKGKLTKN
jgi:hypothetical protein